MKPSSSFFFLSKNLIRRSNSKILCQYKNLGDKSFSIGYSYKILIKILFNLRSVQNSHFSLDYLSEDLTKNLNQERLHRLVYCEYVNVHAKKTMHELFRFSRS